MWVNNPGATDANHYLLSNTSAHHYLYVNGSTLATYGQGGTSYYVYVTVEGALPIGQWSHVAMVREGTVISVYTNGVRRYTYTNSQPHHFNVIGNYGGYTSADYKFGGLIDEIRVSTVARYSGESYTVPTSAFPTA